MSYSPIGEMLEPRVLLSVSGSSSVRVEPLSARAQQASSAAAEIRKAEVDLAASTVQLRGVLENSTETHRFEFRTDRPTRVWQWDTGDAGPNVRRQLDRSATQRGADFDPRQFVFDVSATSAFPEGAYDVTLTLDDEPNRPSPAVTRMVPDSWAEMTRYTVSRTFDYSGDRDVLSVRVRGNTRLVFDANPDLRFALIAPNGGPR